MELLGAIYRVTLYRFFLFNPTTFVMVEVILDSVDRKQLMLVSPWQLIFSNCNFSHIAAGVAVALICALISFIMF
jgi:hypothetical protein